MELDKGLQESLINVLALIYNNTDWKFIRAKSSWDVFNHRVRAAARKGTVGGFVSKLCNYLGIQSLPPESVSLLQQLEKHSNDVLDYAYREHILICVEAIARAKELRSEKKKKQEEKYD